MPGKESQYLYIKNSAKNRDRENAGEDIIKEKKLFPEMKDTSVQVERIQNPAQLLKIDTY